MKVIKKVNYVFKNNPLLIVDLFVRKLSVNHFFLNFLKKSSSEITKNDQFYKFLYRNFYFMIYLTFENNF